MTNYKLLWLDKSIVSLEAIRLLIAEVSKSEEIAQRIVQNIYDSAKRLAFMPRLAPKINEITGLRRLVVGNYYIFYRVFEEKKLIQIERIMDQRQDSSFVT